MKLRYFYKIDQNKNPIPASNVRRKSKPTGHQWKELLNICCNPIIVSCTCDFRYFVQVDPRGNPIDYTLIRRITKPTPDDGIHYAEVESSKNLCCGLISWQFITPNLVGIGTIDDDTHEVVNAVIDSTGSFRPNHGSIIDIEIDTSACVDTSGFILSVLEDNVSIYNSTVTPTFSFTFDATKNYSISMTSTCTP